MTGLCSFAWKVNVYCNKRLLFYFPLFVVQSVVQSSRQLYDNRFSCSPSFIVQVLFIFVSHCCNDLETDFLFSFIILFFFAWVVKFTHLWFRKRTHTDRHRLYYTPTHEQTRFEIRTGRTHIYGLNHFLVGIKIKER